MPIEKWIGKWIENAPYDIHGWIIAKVETTDEMFKNALAEINLAIQTTLKPKDDAAEPENGTELEILVISIARDRIELGFKGPRDEVRIMRQDTHMKDLQRGHGSKINDEPRQRYPRT